VRNKIGSVQQVSRSREHKYDQDNGGFEVFPPPDCVGLSSFGPPVQNSSCNDAEKVREHDAQKRQRRRLEELVLLVEIDRKSKKSQHQNRSDAVAGKIEWMGFRLNLALGFQAANYIWCQSNEPSGSKVVGQGDHERFGPEWFDLSSSRHLNQDDSHDQQRQ
jgi:hypothetical protein